MKIKPSIPRGMRDFSADTIAKRNYILNTVKNVFECYSFAPIETSAMENINTLTGKYGVEGDKLIFKILNSGDYLSKTQLDSNLTSQKLTPEISGKALRYDLTVPFARYVAQNRNDIIFPFRRYQMQKVWRADRPQKGRFREFFQCDADDIGTTSLLCKVELIQIYDDVFTKLGILDTTIRLNNRKILIGITELMEATENSDDIISVLDKINNIGLEQVNLLLTDKGVSKKGIDIFQKYINTQDITKLRNLLSSSKIGMEGVNELTFIMKKIDNIGLKSSTLKLDSSLARGLDYYTGTILEVQANDIEIGSIGGGGRYDDLTSIFGLNDVSGVGISFGIDRIYLVMEELDCFPNKISKRTKLMFTNLGEEEVNYCLILLSKLRNANVNSEIFPQQVKLKKQMDYANKKGIEFVIIVGDNEIKSDLLTVKNMSSGEQKEMSIEDLITQFI